MPNQPAGAFWAVLNRLLIIFQAIVLILSEIGWPMAFFNRFFPILGDNFGLGALGVIQCLYVFLLCFAKPWLGGSASALFVLEGRLGHGFVRAERAHVRFRPIARHCPSAETCTIALRALAPASLFLL